MALKLVLYLLDDEGPLTTLPSLSKPKSIGTAVTGNKPSLFICKLLAFMPGLVLPPLKGYVGTFPIANTGVIPVIPEKLVIVTLQLADVEEKEPITNVFPVEQPLQDTQDVVAVQT